ncbi:MAG TPA: hypothetical protein DDW28_11125, partial [Prevotella sp.]|nr:hypothetical protein [Candidatus Segatella violae]
MSCKVTHILLIIKRKDTFFRKILIFITINADFFVILHVNLRIMDFQLTSKYKPTGDQPQAIR